MHRNENRGRVRVRCGLAPRGAGGPELAIRRRGGMGTASERAKGAWRSDAKVCADVLLTIDNENEIVVRVVKSV